MDNGGVNKHSGDIQEQGQGGQFPVNSLLCPRQEKPTRE